MAIEIEILTDTAKAEKGLGNLADGFEDVEKAAKDAERSLEGVENEAKSAGDAIGNELSGGMDDAGEAAEGFGASAEDATGRAKTGLDGVKDTAGNLADDVVPGLGAAFTMGIGGLAVGAITLLVEWLKRSAEESEEARQKAQDLAQAIVDAGGDIEKLDVAEAIREWGYEAADVKSWFEPWQERTITNFEKWNEKLAEGSVAWADFAEAMSGANPEKTNEALEETERLLAAEEKRREEILRILQTSADLTDAERDALRQEWAARVDNIQALTDQRDELQKVADQQGLAIKYAGLEADAIENTTAALEAKREELEEQTDAYQSLIEAELDYHDALDEVREALEENGSTLDKSTEAGRANWEALLELREATDAQAEAMAAQGATAGEVASFMAGARAQFVEAATAMGMSQEEAAALADQLGLIPSEVSTRYEFTGPSPSQVRSEYDQRAAVIPDKEEVPIQFQASGTQAQAAVNSAMSKVVRPILKVRLQAENNVGVGYRRA